MKGISKRFGPVEALRNVQLEVWPQTIHALIGENGAGKTTLMKILQGTYQPDEGTISVRGETVTMSNHRVSQQHGIGMVSQHYSIIPELTALQNLLLGAEPGPVLPLGSAAIRADSLAAKMGFQFDWHASAEELSTAGGQKLEVLKLLWRDASIMILDEPTAMLSPQDSEAMYASLKQLVATGATVIVVTHRIPEVMDHCDRLTVLRGGETVAEREVAGLSSDEIAELIVGRSVPTSGDATSFTPGAPLFHVDKLRVLNQNGHLAVKDVSFDIGEGEVLGLAGVDGNGQRELFHAIMGQATVVSGEMKLADVSLSTLPTREVLAAGVRLIPEDRHAEGCIESWSLADNAILGTQREPRTESRDSVAARIATRFRTKFSTVSTPLKTLSGGNQQRFVAGRALEGNSRLLLAFQPTRGLDIASIHEVYQAIREHCRTTGAAALIVSFDLDELILHCDRIVAISHGHLSEPPTGKAKDRTEIGKLMVGA